MFAVKASSGREHLAAVPSPTVRLLSTALDPMISLKLLTVTLCESMKTDQNRIFFADPSTTTKLST